MNDPLPRIQPPPERISDEQLTAFVERLDLILASGSRYRWVRFGKDQAGDLALALRELQERRESCG